MPKMLLIFCDGTGMDGNLSARKPAVRSTEGGETAVCEHGVPDMSNRHTVDGGNGGTVQFPTNVICLEIRLHEHLANVCSDGKEQIIFYQSGVGSEANFEGNPVVGAMTLAALGTAVVSKIHDAYALIAQNFQDGDEICIFGFSRGAYTARKLSGLIDCIGLLTGHNLGLFFTIWRQLMDGETPTIPPDTQKPRIKCVGVWDTVGSVYDTIDVLKIKYTSLPATVDIALHALSLQENRKAFLPMLWSIPEGGLSSDQILKQVWFPGAHSDVGGSYNRHELQDIALFWRQPNPKPWGTSQPHNAYIECDYVTHLVVGHENHLQSRQITTTSIFHKSLEFSPQKLASSDYMVTTSIIQKEFSSGFHPDHPALNEFEAYCKDNWSRELMGNSRPPVFDNPDIVIQSAV